MTEFDFGAFRRIPRIDLSAFPFKSSVRNFCHYTLYVDYRDISHMQALAEFAKELIHEDRRAQRASYEFLKRAGVTSLIKEFQTRRAEGALFPRITRTCSISIST